MNTDFVPKKRSSLKDEIKKALLVGLVLRCDGIDENPVEILSRDIAARLPRTGNIGQLTPDEKLYLLHTMSASSQVVQDVVAELNKEYCVQEIRCSGSGCGQYTTKGYYLLEQ